MFKSKVNTPLHRHVDPETGPYGSGVRRVQGVKTSQERVIRLAQLERELRSIPDSDLAASIDALPDEARPFLSYWVPVDQPAADHIAGLRAALDKGRVKNVPMKVTEVVTAPCLNSCIEALGDKADMPLAGDLIAINEALVTQHGVRITRLMYLSTMIAGAPAAAAIATVLKSDPTLALPA
jgi:hypothetical protein